MTIEDDRSPTKRIGRRQMLARLGMAAGAAYMVPTMLSLTQARASGGSFSGASSYSASSYSGASSFSSYSGPRSSGGGSSLTPANPRRLRRGSSYSGPRRRLNQWHPFLRRLFGA